MKWTFLGQCWPSKRPSNPTGSWEKSDSSHEVSLDKDEQVSAEQRRRRPESPRQSEDVGLEHQSTAPDGLEASTSSREPALQRQKLQNGGASHQQYPYFLVSEVGLEAAISPFSWQGLADNDVKTEVADAGTYAIAGLTSSQEAFIQDRTVIALNLGPPSQSASDPSSEAGLYALFDGHGANGHEVSEQLANHVVGIFRRRLLQEKPENVVPSFRDAFHEMETLAAKAQDSQSDWTQSGASGTVAICSMGHIIVAGVGDTTAVLGSCTDGQWRTIDMTVDHTPDVDLEATRIRAAGGVIKPFGPEGSSDGTRPMRIFHGDSAQPALTTTRCLGNAGAKRIGVAWEPQYFLRRLQKEDKFLVICSAGVWEHVTREEAIQMVRGHESAEEASWELASEARRRGHLQSLLRDHTDVSVRDVSALVLFFGKAGEQRAAMRRGRQSGRNNFMSTAAPAAIDIPSDVISHKFKIWVEAEQARVVASQRTKDELRQMLVEDDAPSRPLDSPHRTHRPMPPASPASGEDFTFLQEDAEQDPAAGDVIYAF